jgi:macrophage erythroblast attacher
MQEFIELCRKRDISTAIVYARKNLAPWASSHMTQIQHLMALLSFGEKTGVKLYRVSRIDAVPILTGIDPQYLYDQAQWRFVQQEFRKTFLTLYALPGQPLLSLALSAGLSTLRLPSCAQYHRPNPSSPKSPTVPLVPAAPPMHTTFGDFVMSSPLLPDSPHHQALLAPQPVEEEVTGNVDCPTCAPDLVVLASEVPMSHHVISTLVCRISGKVMDSSNPPMAFPNGYVYSYNVSAAKPGEEWLDADT